MAPEGFPGGGGPLIGQDGNRKSQQGGPSFRFSNIFHFLWPSPRRDAPGSVMGLLFREPRGRCFCGFIGQVL